jgi:hypothetical protein
MIHHPIYLLDRAKLTCCVLAGFADNLTSQSATIIPILINAAGGIVLDCGWSTLIFGLLLSGVLQAIMIHDG